MMNVTYVKRCHFLSSKLTVYWNSEIGVIIKRIQFNDAKFNESDSDPVHTRQMSVNSEIMKTNIQCVSYSI
jgi:hypothetical protein